MFAKLTRLHSELCIMGLRSCPQLMPFLMLISAHCVGANIYPTLFTNESTMSWGEARQYCRDNYVDLATADSIGPAILLPWMRANRVSESMWIGLHRDPRDDKTWNWIDERTADGLLNQAAIVNWTKGAKNAHCAAVRGQNFLWYSQACTTPSHMCCSSSINITCEGITTKTWSSTKRYCEEQSQVMPTITAENENQLLNDSWIGLYREARDTWKWDDGTPVDYTNWAPGEPRTKDCGSFNFTSIKANSHQCSEKLRPLCFGDNLVVVQLKKTWEEALHHCRALKTPCPTENCTYRYRLLMPKNATESDYLARRVQRAGITSEVWVGLRFLAGQWWRTDGWSKNHQLTLPDCPSHWEHCAAGQLESNSTVLRDCSQRKSFVCRGHKVWIGPQPTSNNEDENQNVNEDENQNNENENNENESEDDDD